MPRTKEQFEEMRNATRAKIQSAAMQLFAQQGFGMTNVQEIADKAGISIGLLYRHYKTKDELFHELAEFAAAGLARVAERFQSDESPSVLMKGFVQEIYEDMVSGDDLANLMILMSQSFHSIGDTNDGQNGVVTVNKNLIMATSKLIKRGQELDEFAAGDSYEMAMFFFSFIQGLAEMKVKMKDDFVMPSPSILTAFLFSKGG
ncbi:TetR/AcrR family transcriptional regulator [Paenibacillus sp. 1011MAR3C5]|uniref:TetR/AcrR family transcriptional regulator n=1 Tax=Paenibacillus sp. 1011MAR3C5 TaxID=1675787 RepID=UPI000E6CEEDF|nr:TetR/AcrR family transcriptional regulator [Paenibacillus sp. 1011MAR3C5]RJE84756.1 TetR/AcrR family transcriptional regulator [Paenibacillus sp. 1011MAR3C5]